VRPLYSPSFRQTRLWPFRRHSRVFRAPNPTAGGELAPSPGYQTTPRNSPRPSTTTLLLPPLAHRDEARFLLGIPRRPSHPKLFRMECFGQYDHYDAEQAQQTRRASPERPHTLHCAAVFPSLGERELPRRPPRCSTGPRTSPRSAARCSRDRCKTKSHRREGLLLLLLLLLVGTT
jgi:hypothetical protein